MPDVARVRDAPERERRVALLPGRQIRPPVYRDHARRMRRARNVGEQLRFDVLARPEQVDRRHRRSGDSVLALDEEQPELLAPALVVQLPNELEAVVVPGDDHSRSTVLTDVFL